MNVLHYLPRVVLADGGVVRSVLDLCALLASSGHAVTLLSTHAPDAPEPWRAGGSGLPHLVEVPPPTRPMGLFSPAAAAALEPMLRSCDVVHLHTPWETSNTQLATLARRASRPYVVTVHGMLDDWCMAQKRLKKRIYLSLAGRALLERAARVHCTAQAEHDQASKWYPRGRGVVIPLAVDLAEYRDLPGPEAAIERIPTLASASQRVLFLSRLHVKKGVHVAIDAIAGVAGAHLFLAGVGDEDYARGLREQVERLGLADRVHFLGLVTGREKLSLYQACEVFVLPTSQENFGLVLPEAMACRTPVVTTRGVDIWPELEASGGAVIADATPGAFAETIRVLLADPDRRREMGERGRAWVFEHLDASRVVERFVALYREVIAEGRGGTPAKRAPGP